MNPQGIPAEGLVAAGAVAHVEIHQAHPALPQVELLERGKGSQGSKVARRLALLKWRRSSPMRHGNMNCRGRVIHASFVQVLVIRLYGPVAGNGNHVRHLLRSNLRGFVSSILLLGLHSSVQLTLILQDVVPFGLLEPIVVHVRGGNRGCPGREGLGAHALPLSARRSEKTLCC